MSRLYRGAAFAVGFGVGCLLAVGVYYLSARPRPLESGPPPLAQTPSRQQAQVSQKKAAQDEERARIWIVELEKLMLEWDEDENRVESGASERAEAERVDASESPMDESSLPPENLNVDDLPAEEGLRYQVEAELVAKSPMPVFEETPFRNVLVVYEYRILKHIKGLTDRVKMRVAHWAIRGDIQQPALEYEVGGAHMLRLRPYESPDGAYVSNAFPMDDGLPLLMEEDPEQDAEGPGHGWNALLPPPPPSSLL